MINSMVNRFLGWRLPVDFHPDCGITFKAEYNEGSPHQGRYMPTGTNLFTATQAKEMFEYVTEGYTHPLHEWISVKDRLPAKHERVIVCRNHEEVFINWLSVVPTRLWGLTDCGITHWMPLPTPPKE